MAKKEAATSSYRRLKKHSQTALLEPEQIAALRALCARTRVPMQTFLREGVDLVLAKHATKTARVFVLSRRRWRQR